MSACNCMGPQNGEPLCPCMMKDVKIIDGRYVKTEDLGPAPSGVNRVENSSFYRREGKLKLCRWW